MSNHAGVSTTYGTILPNSAALSRIKSIKLSKQAKHRLAVIEYYLYKSDSNVCLTCRHYGIGRSYFYKWWNRYNPKNLNSLENRSKRPNTVRQATYNYNLVKLVRKLRTDKPSYSSKKLKRILKRDYDISYSHSTIGRIIKKYNLYFTAAIKAAKKRSKRAKQVWKRRKPYNLKASKPRQVVEFDMKHIYICGQKQYAFVAIDIFTKQICLRVANRPSSYQASLALQEAVKLFGDEICIITDNGSENYKHSYEYLKKQNVTQYFARPHTPKDKPHVENVIGKLQQECLDEDRTHKTLDERKEQVCEWINDYHYYRPHQALDYLTPEEYCDTLNLTIPRTKVSTM